MDLFTKAWLWAGLFSLLALLISLYLVYKHLRNYTAPALQKYIVRIIFMVPIYAIASWLSLRFIDYALYFNLIRDCYEAYVIYMFFNLLEAFINTYDDETDETTDLSHLHGEERVVAILSAKPLSEHPWPFCCFPQFQPGRDFLRNSKRWVLQFVVVKPLLALIAIVLEHYELFDEGHFDLDRGYVYITIAENVSITLSMYYLVLFYHVTKDELARFNPIPKFLCIKIVVMFAFWQGVIIAILTFSGVIHGTEEWTTEKISTGLQDFIICIEMFFVALAHAYAFSYDTYRDTTLCGSLQTLLDCCCCIWCWCFCCCCSWCRSSSLRDVVSQGDVVDESLDLFGVKALLSRNNHRYTSWNQSSKQQQDGGSFQEHESETL